MQSFSLLDDDQLACPVGICKAPATYYYVKGIDLLTVPANVRIWLYLKKSPLIKQLRAAFPLSPLSLSLFLSALLLFVYA